VVGVPAAFLWLTAITYLALSIPAQKIEFDQKGIAYRASSSLDATADLRAILTDGDVNSFWHIDHNNQNSKIHFIDVFFNSDFIARSHNQKICFQFRPRGEETSNFFRAISLEGTSNGIFFRGLGSFSATRLPNVIDMYSACTDALNYKSIRVNFLNGYRAFRFYSVGEFSIAVSPSESRQNLIQVVEKSQNIITHPLSVISHSKLAGIFLMCSIAATLLNCYVCASRKTHNSNLCNVFALGFLSLIAIFTSGSAFSIFIAGMIIVIWASSAHGPYESAN
jgi:hypothetical protein